VRGYLYSAGQERTPIELEVTDQETISKLKVGMVGDFEILEFELGEKVSNA